MWFCLPRRSLLSFSLFNGCSAKALCFCGEAPKPSFLKPCSHSSALCAHSGFRARTPSSKRSRSYRHWQTSLKISSLFILLSSFSLLPNTCYTPSSSLSSISCRRLSAPFAVRLLVKAFSLQFCRSVRKVRNFCSSSYIMMPSFILNFLLFSFPLFVVLVFLPISLQIIYFSVYNSAFFLFLSTITISPPPTFSYFKGSQKRVYRLYYLFEICFPLDIVYMS